jgi:RNA methyltransferase, TrmH family
MPVSGKTELRICGLAAVLARHTRAPGSIIRLFFDAATAPRLGDLCRELAKARKVYRCVEGEELVRVGGTVHHGGVVAVVYQEPPRPVRQEDFEHWAAHRRSLLLLDRIGNMHNLGALARTAAFYGVEHIVLQDDPLSARPGDAAYRVAEGGLEHITVWSALSLPRLAEALDEVGYEVVGAATRGGVKKLGKPGAPIALALGNEETGLSPELAGVCTRLITLPGSGRVESLNVSVAGAILLDRLLGRAG